MDTPPDDSGPHAYGPHTYGELIADEYDAMYGGVPALTTAAAAPLADLADGGPALELGIGTGNVALPLAARGVPVHGIDASLAMVARLRSKPGGDAIPVAIGDMADCVPPPEAPAGGYPLVYVVFNTLFMLTSQEEQVRCLGNVAARLAPGGRFVVHAFVPDLASLSQPSAVSGRPLDLARARLDLAAHLPDQRIDAMHVVLGPDGIRTYPIRLRYAWPSELDLMARLAGLGLEHRWGGWDRSDFDDTAAFHVSVYRKP